MAGSERPTTIFLSYSRQDARLAHQIREHLTRQGIGVWLDLDSIPPTSEWLDRILRGIESADSFIFVISPDSVASEVCVAVELAHAVTCGKRIISVRARRTPHAAIPAAVSARQWIDFADESSHTAAFTQLEWSLAADLEWLQQHTWLLGLAANWDGRRRDPSALLAGRALADAVEWLQGADDHHDPEVTPLHRDFITASQRNQELLDAVASVTHGEALVRNEQPQRARAEFESASRAFGRWGVSQVLADLGLWSSIRTAPYPDVWIPARGAPVLSAGWTAAGTLFSLERSGVLRQFSSEDGALLEEDELPVSELMASLVTPDCSTLVVGNATGELLVWDIGQRRVARRWHGHDERVSALAVDASGATLVSGSFDCSAKVWDSGTGKLTCELIGHATPVSSVAISGDGSRVLTASLGLPDIPGQNALNLAGQGEDQTLRCWAVPEATQSPGLDWIRRGVWAVVSVAGGAEFVTAGMGLGDAPSGLEVWHGVTLEPLGSLASSLGHVSDLAVSFDGSLLLLGSGSSDLYVWDRRLDRCVSVLTHEDDLVAMAMSADGKSVVAAASDGGLVSWKVRDERALRTVTTSCRAVSRVELAAGANCAVSAASVRTEDIGSLAWTNDMLQGGHYPLEVWDIPTGAALGVLGISDSPVLAMAAADDLRFAVTATLDGQVTLWRGGKPTPLNVGAEDTVFDLALDADGRLLLVTSGSNVAVYDLQAERVTQTFVGHEEIVRSATFVTARNAVASVSDDGTLRVWNQDSGQELLVFDHPDAGITQVAVSGDGRWLMAGTLDGVRAWDLDAPARPLQMFGHRGRVGAVCLSRDGSVGASGGDDGFIRIWHVPTGRELHALHAHDREVSWMAFAEDDTTVLSASMDGTLTVLDLLFGRQVPLLAKLARDAFRRLGDAPNADVLRTLGRWGSLRGDWYAASRYFDEARWQAPSTQPDLSAVRAHWYSGMPFDALNELDLLGEASAGAQVVLLRRAVARDAVGDLNGQLSLLGGGAAGLMLDDRPDLMLRGDERGLLPLHAAVERGNPGGIDMLLARGTPVDAPMEDGSMRTALHLACALQNEAIARQLIDRGADVRARTHDGWTPLHEAVKCSKELVGLLLARDAEPDAATDGGYTPLHRASLLGRVDVAEVLLRAGASVAATDQERLTALHFAASGGDPATVRLLLSSDADRAARDARGRTAADVAIEKGQAAAALLLSTKP